MSVEIVSQKNHLSHQKEGNAIQPVPIFPAPLELIDFATGNCNKSLTPGGLAQLIGRQLNFEFSDRDQGLFLVTDSGKETRIEAVGLNEPGRLMFMFPPNLASDHYALQVRSKNPKSNKVHTGELNGKLITATPLKISIARN